MGAAAFVEIAYQMEGLAEVLVASQRLLPDNGWPYDQILSTWQQRIVAGQAEAREIGRLIVDTVANTYAPQDVRMVAVNLGALDDTGRVLDTLALALMQSLGDWHVLQAVRCAVGKTDWISAEIPAAASSTSSILPAVDMLEFLEQLRQTLVDEAPQTPEVFGQRQRLMHLQGLIDKALQALMPHSQAPSRLILHAQPTPQRGLSILMPPVRTAFVQDDETAVPAFTLAHSNYLNLEFSQHVHWAALIGAFRTHCRKAVCALALDQCDARRLQWHDA